MISIVNYNMGNLRSIQNALTYLGFNSRIISSPEEVLISKKLILPGIGSFRRAMEHIRTMMLLDALNEAALRRRIPILGICLGMQLLGIDSEEGGLTQGFGWIPGKVRCFPAKELSIKVPHIGFNTVYFEPALRNLFKGLKDHADFYFAHSYRMVCEEPKGLVSSWSNYGENFAASVQYENIFGVQFHPERSQSNGLTFLRNFCEIKTKR